MCTTGGTIARAIALLSSSSAAFGFISFRPCNKNIWRHYVKENSRNQLKRTCRKMLILPANPQQHRLILMEVLPPLPQLQFLPPHLSVFFHHQPFQLLQVLKVPQVPRAHSPYTPVSETACLSQTQSIEKVSHSISHISKVISIHLNTEEKLLFNHLI